MGFQLFRNLRAHAEPALEARHGLIEQHAETVHGLSSPRASRSKKRSFERAVDDIGDNGVLWQSFDLDVERTLAGHSEARGIDQQPAAGKRLIAGVPIDDAHSRAERSGQNLGAIPCAVGEKNARCTLRDKTVEDGPRCTACAKHHYWSPPLVPVRGLLVEGGHEAVSVGIAGV